MKVKIVNKSAYSIPSYSTSLSAGMDLRPRSGLAINHGISVLSSPGTIDADYWGEIGVIVVNLSKESFTIHPEDRICQLVFSKYEVVEWQEMAVLDIRVHARNVFI